MRLQFVSISLIVVAIGARPLQAQSDHMHQLATESKSLTQAQGALLQIVKSSTVRFKGVSAAEAEGYHLAFGCVTGPDAGAMGLHYVKMPLVVDPPMMPNGEPDPTQPQIVIYEPLPDGGLHLIGADYLILADPWEKAHPLQDDGPALSLFRSTQSLRTSGVLHTARLGMEGKSQWCVRELASECFLRVLFGANAMSHAHGECGGGANLKLFAGE